MITLGQILDLVDYDRAAADMVNIMNCNGFKSIKAMVCIPLWEGAEDREVKKIQAEGSELYIWLED